MTFFEELLLIHFILKNRLKYFLSTPLVFTLRLPTLLETPVSGNTASNEIDFPSTGQTKISFFFEESLRMWSKQVLQKRCPHVIIWRGSRKTRWHAPHFMSSGIWSIKTKSYPFSDGSMVLKLRRYPLYVFCSFSVILQKAMMIFWFRKSCNGFKTKLTSDGFRNYVKIQRAGNKRTRCDVRASRHPQLLRYSYWK